MSRISELLPDFQPFAEQLISAAAQAGLNPQVTSTRRSFQLQKRLYERYLKGESRYPAAPPGQSSHEFGFAFDLLVSPYSALSDVGYTWQQWGGIWGPGDPIHFEYPGFDPTAAVQGMYGEEIGASTTYAKVASGAAGFLPGPVGILASVSPTPVFVKGKPVSEWTWQDWLDPQCFFHSC